MDFVTSDNWISTKVGLPHRNRDVLVLVERRLTDDYVQLAYFKGMLTDDDAKQEWHETYAHGDSRIYEPVAYWCYIPTIPQEFKDTIANRMFKQLFGEGKKSSVSGEHDKCIAQNWKEYREFMKPVMSETAAELKVDDGK